MQNRKTTSNYKSALEQTYEQNDIFEFSGKKKPTLRESTGAESGY